MGSMIPKELHVKYNLYYGEVQRGVYGRQRHLTPAAVK